MALKNVLAGRRFGGTRWGPCCCIPDNDDEDSQMTRNLLLSSAIAMFLAAPAMAQTTPPAASPDKPAATDADKPATMGTDKPAASTDMKTGTDTGTSTTGRSEEHTSELPSLMRLTYAVFCMKKQKQTPDK